MERKSNKDIMRLFPEPYQSQWFKKCNRDTMNSYFDGAIRATSSFFDYPQGGDYWHNIANMIRNHERDDDYYGCNNKLL